MRCLMVCMIAAFLLASPCVQAQEEADKGRSRHEDMGKGYVAYKEWTLHPAPSPRLGLKHRLITPPHELNDRNAGVYYLGAMGFFEQHRALREVMDRTSKWAQEADGESFPPYSWVDDNLPISELPLDEAKDFLVYLSFQSRYLERASKARFCDLENSMADGVEDGEHPWTILLPEVQSLREIARYQALRARVALAEGRHEDAIRIMRESYMLAHHLGQSDILVTVLVGIACSGMTNNSVLYDYQQEPGTPNLYWALAAMPSPLVDDSLALSTECNNVTSAIPILGEVDETPRSVEYWHAFIDRSKEHTELLFEWNLDDFEKLYETPGGYRAMLTAYAITAYPEARRYLIEDCALSDELVDAYPVAQTVMLATVYAAEELSDLEQKWSTVPLWQQETHSDWDDEYAVRCRIGTPSLLGVLILPATRMAHQATIRNQRDFAAHQTVEAIRMYGAENDRRLPPTLDDLPVPAPLDPSTGKPFDYTLNDDGTATLESYGPLTLGLHWRLRFAQEE